MPLNGSACPDFRKWFDGMAKYDYVGLYMHPHMALKKKHWDGVNYRYGNNCEWRKWKQVEDRDPADTAVYYERLKAFIKAAPDKIDLSTFLPPEINVGGRMIGPADFLFAALEVIETGSASVKVVPREQLGSFKEVPTIEFMNISNSWVHTKEFKDQYLSERLRLQLWTLRIE